MEVLLVVVVLVVGALAWKALTRPRPAAPIVVTVTQTVPESAAGTPVKVDKDAWEEWDYMGMQGAGGGHELHRRLRIHFTDKEGKRTEREIDLKKFFTDGKDGLMHAYCHLRKGNRPFRLSRVSQALDLDTGETVQDLPAWLQAQYKDTPRGAADAFIDEHGDALSALFFVSKADGALRKAEREHLAEFCRSVGGAPAEVVDLVVQDVSEWAMPSAIGYGKALRAAAEMPDEYRRRILETARKMVESDKTTKDEEVKALGRMAKELGFQEA